MVWWHALVTSFTKRFSNRWQFAVTSRSAPSRIQRGLRARPYAVRRQRSMPSNYLRAQADVEGEHTYANTDQRHRAVMNGIWDVSRGCS